MSFFGSSRLGHTLIETIVVDVTEVATSRMKGRTSGLAADQLAICFALDRPRWFS
jgi:hypothetical protein